MRLIQLLVAVPFAVACVVLLLPVLRRNARISFHDYQGNQKQKLRDSFVSSFGFSTLVLSIFQAFVPLSLWTFAVPLTLVIIAGTTVFGMAGAYVSSFFYRLAADRHFHREPSFRDRTVTLASADDPAWYELAPFALAAGWLACFLIEASLAFSAGLTFPFEDAPLWMVLAGLLSGVSVTVLGVMWMHRKTDS